MIKFNEFINEKTLNMFDNDIKKEKYVDVIWNLLQESYKSIGGIKGSGFESKEAMMKKIKMWKIAKANNKIVAGILYKDKNDIRKSVAVFTDNSKKGKSLLTNMLKDDFKRSSIEISHDLLKFVEKRLSSLIKKYAIPSNEVENILKKEIKIIDDYKYEREINGTKITKMMLGTQKSFR